MRLLPLVLLSATLSFAQPFQGTLRGLILYPRSHAVQIAKDSLNDEGISDLRATGTSDLGESTFASLTPSCYLPPDRRTCPTRALSISPNRGSPARHR